MPEYIERNQILDYIAERKAKMIASADGKHAVSIETVEDIIKNFPDADVAPVIHGQIIWKERHRGGFETAKCLHYFNDINMENNIPCKHIAKIDGRYTVKEPYCSKCGKLLGDFLNYCGNCGVKMDGKAVKEE